MKALSISIFTSLILISCSGLPKVDFSWVPEDNPEAGDTIRFMNESKRADNFRWDFGDGGSSLDYEPVYVYKNAGIFDVSLDASNDKGSTLGLEALTIYDPTVLSFVIYDSTESTLITGASVWVYDNESDRDQLLSPLYSGVTDQEGSIEFRNVDVLVYHVWVNKAVEGGAWSYRGYTNPVLQNKVNIYQVPCTWRTTSMTLPSTHLMAATTRSSN